MYGQCASQEQVKLLNQLALPDDALTMSECPPASTTCTYPWFSFASPLDTSRLSYLTLWTTFCALLGWQSGNLSVSGLHSHLSVSSLSLSLEFWEYGTYAPRMCTECISSALDGCQCLYPSWWVPSPSHGVAIPWHNGRLEYHIGGIYHLFILHMNALWHRAHIFAPRWAKTLTHPFLVTPHFCWPQSPS